MMKEESIFGTAVVNLLGFGCSPGPYSEICKALKIIEKTNRLHVLMNT